MVFCGLDIGGTKIETALFNHDLSLIKSWRIPTPTSNYQTFLQEIKKQVSLVDQLSNAQCPVGIGIPGVIAANGTIISANIPCANNKNIINDLSELLQRPIQIKNDAHCFALSEANGGAGQGYQRTFTAILGTGAAGGLCINGQLTQTAMGIAGEYGHTPLSAYLQHKYQLPILTCGCGLHGCVEQYISGSGIANLYQHFQKVKQSAQYFGQQLNQADKLAETIFNCYIDILGETFATISKLLEPDIIVLAGGVSHIKQISAQLPNAIQQHLFANCHAPKVVNAKFADISGVRGAALLAKNSTSL